MKRPMCVIGFSFFIAIWAAFSLERHHALLLSFALVLTGAVLLFFHKSALRLWTTLLLTAGMALACYSLSQWRAVEPYSTLQRERVEVLGIVEEVAAVANATRYTIKATFPENPGLPPSRIQVNQYGGGDFAVGDTLRGEATLTAATGRWYRSRGIAATGYFRSVEEAPTAGFRGTRMLLWLRSALNRNLYQNLPIRTAESVSGMVMGDTTGIDHRDYLAMQRSGTVHLLVVSGLHLSVLSGFVQRLLERFRCKSGLRFLALFLAGGLFVLVVGLTPSVVRAFTMVMLSSLGSVLSRRADSLNSMGFALLLIGLFAPHWILGTGLWLSAAATSGIAILGTPLSERFKRLCPPSAALSGKITRFLAEAMGVSCAAYLFTLPILVATNGWMPLLSPVANALVAPFVPGVVVGGMLCAALPATFLPVRLIALAVTFCNHMTMALSRLFSAPAFAVLSLDEVWKLLFVLLSGGLVGWLVWTNKQKTIVLLTGCALLFAFVAGEALTLSLREKQIELVTLDRGGPVLLLRGGSAVVVGTPDRNGVARLTRYLSFRGVEQVDLLVATDFRGGIHSGIITLRDALPVAAVLGPADDFARGQLARAFPGADVYRPEDARVTALGGVLLQAGEEGETTMDALTFQAVKTPGGYDIIGQYGRDTVVLARDGNYLPRGIRPRWTPIGSHVFSEERLLFDL